MTTQPTDKLKGISTPGEMERLSGILNGLSDSISKGQIPTLSFTPQSQPDVQLKRIPEGYTYYDKDTKKVRTWDGAAWRDHF